jgi:hypothetical protein
MDKIIGLGAAGVNIVNVFKQYPQYKGYCIDVGLKGLKKDGIYALEKQDNPERYEENCPSVKNFLKGATPDLMMVLANTGHVSAASLPILEQVKERNINIMLINSDERRQSDFARLIGRSTFGILQEYARSGLFKDICLISNKSMETIIGDIPVIGYYDALNNMLVNTVHMVNVFDHSEPVISDFSNMPENYRISTYGISDLEEKEEKLFFPLDNIRQVRYYIAINRKQLEEDGSLNKKIKEFLDNSREEGIDVSYGVYATNYDKNLVYCRAYTNIIQESK